MYIDKSGHCGKAAVSFIVPLPLAVGAGVGHLTRNRSNAIDIQMACCRSFDEWIIAGTGKGRDLLYSYRLLPYTAIVPMEFVKNRSSAKRKHNSIQPWEAIENHPHCPLTNISVTTVTTVTTARPALAIGQPSSYCNNNNNMLPSKGCSTSFWALNGHHISHGLPIFVLLFELCRLYLYALFSVGYLARHTEKNRQLPISLILSIGEKNKRKRKDGVCLYCRAI